MRRPSTSRGQYRPCSVRIVDGIRALPFFFNRPCFSFRSQEEFDRFCLPLRALSDMDTRVADALMSVLARRLQDLVKERSRIRETVIDARNAAASGPGRLPDCTLHSLFLLRAETLRVQLHDQNEVQCSLIEDAMVSNVLVLFQTRLTCSSTEFPRHHGASSTHSSYP